jgi:hypothetical protein
MPLVLLCIIINDLAGKAKYFGSYSFENCGGRLPETFFWLDLAGPGWTWLDLGAERAALVVFGRLMNVTQRRETMVETERIRPHQAGRERPKRGCAGKDRAGWRLFRAFINHFSFLLLV